VRLELRADEAKRATTSVEVDEPQAAIGGGN